MWGYNLANVRALLLALACIGREAAPVRPAGSVVDVPAGQEVVANIFYWISRNPCASRLNEVTAMSVVSGNVEGLELPLRRGQTSTPWQCPQLTVPTAHALVRQIRAFPAPEARTVNIVVTYDTMEGPQTSRHELRRNILPPASAVTPIRIIP